MGLLRQIDPYYLHFRFYVFMRKFDSKRMDMTAIELKEKIIAQISSTNDEELLGHISKVIDIELHANDIHIMSPAEIEAVNDGLAQLENGQWITNEESNKRVDEWLKKYDGR